MDIKNYNKGFSLVELIFVIVVLAIIMGVVVVTYPRLVKDSRLKSDRASATYIAKALRSWHTDCLSDQQKQDEFKAYIEENLYKKTIKLSELASMGVEVFVDSTYRPYSLVDDAGHEIPNQGFYVGIIGDGSNAKFIITVETEDKRLDSVSESSTVNYDGTDIGVIYIES